MTRKIFPAAAIAALVTLAPGLARAQVTGPIPNTGYDTGPTWNMWPTERSRSPADAWREEQSEREYRETLKKIPDRKASSDPWKSVRPSAATGYDKHRVD